MNKKFIIITNAPREYTWEDSYRYNLSGTSDVTQKITNNPSYRKGELCLIHPMITQFYEEHRTSFQEKITENMTMTFPLIIDKSAEYSQNGTLSSFPIGEIPALICETNIKRGMLNEEYLSSIIANYIIVPIKKEEFTEVEENSLESVLNTCEKNNINLTNENKSEIRQKLAILKSFDIYLQENVIRIRDIPVELTLRAGKIDRTTLKKYSY